MNERLLEILKKFGQRPPHEPTPEEVNKHIWERWQEVFCKLAK